MNNRAFIIDGKQVSKYISLILRHKPESAGITLDEHGWADTKELIAGVEKKYPFFGMSMLRDIVRYDEKQRYSFNEDMTKIRANQGHSIPVDLELEAKEPPRFLYHGTARKYEESISKNGLIPKSRQYVHLSADIETARTVGLRHAKSESELVIYMIPALKMHENGYEFFLSENGVWLTKKVPSVFLLNCLF